MKSFDELKALIEKRGVHAEFGDPGEGFAVEQNPHELATFLLRMQELNVTSVLEIGTGYKAGLAHFLAMDMGWAVCSYDVVDYGHKKLVPHEQVAFDLVQSGSYPYTNLDLVFIDGNHSYENVKADYERWGQYANKVIAFHDIAGWRDCQGVKKFWEEISNPVEFGIHKMPNMPFYRSTYYGSNPAGIGWIEL